MSVKKTFSEVRLAWGLLSVLIFIDGMWMLLSGKTLLLLPCVFVLCAAALLHGVAAFYTYVRCDDRLAYLAMTGAQLLIYTAAAGLLSYLLVTLNLPPIDNILVAADHWLGFDWPAMHAWGKAHVFSHLTMIVAYYSLIPQLMLMQIILFTTERFDRGRELFWLFVLTSLGSIVLSGFFPAQGAFVTFNIETNEPYVRQFLALRDGSLKVFDLQNMQGVVQFPSFHLAMAAILTYAARGIRFLFPALLLLNTLVIVATPLVGGHHLADLWGGALLTIAAILFMRRWQKRGFVSIEDTVCG